MAYSLYHRYQYKQFKDTTMQNDPQKEPMKSQNDSPDQSNPQNKPQREGGDEALSNLGGKDAGKERTDVGYTNEERIAEDGEGMNTPPASEEPSGSGIASKE